MYSPITENSPQQMIFPPVLDIFAESVSVQLFQEITEPFLKKKFKFHCAQVRDRKLETIKRWSSVLLILMILWDLFFFSNIELDLHLQ